VQAGGAVPFAPEINRVFMRFRAADGTVVGSTSAALRTQ
jgi:hypothetical protein